MPVSHQRSDSSGMDLDLSPGCRLRTLSRGGSLESSSSSSRSRSLILDDESLRHLTHEEKDVILFFEETIDALEDDLEEQALCDREGSGHSTRSTEGSSSGHSEPEDVIDLVPPGPAAGAPECLPDAPGAAGAGPAGKEDISVPGRTTRDEELPLPVDGPAPRTELHSPPPPAEHPKLPRSVPTPLVVAQKMSAKLAGSGALAPTSPSKDGGPGERRARSGDPAPKTQRFPSNISVTNSAARDFSRTISRAAVSVRERTARVLANIGGALPTGQQQEGTGAPTERPQLQGTGAPTEQPQGTGAPMEQQESPGAPTERPQGPRDRARSEPALSRDAAPLPGSQQRSLGVQTEPCPPLPNGVRSARALTAYGRTITVRPDASRSLHGGAQPDSGPDARRRAGSLPRAMGFRPQGITVQFTGRGSTEQARREALRKLGLLRDAS